MRYTYWYERTLRERVARSACTFSIYGICFSLPPRKRQTRVILSRLEMWQPAPQTLGKIERERRNWTINVEVFFFSLLRQEKKTNIGRKVRTGMYMWLADKTICALVVRVGALILWGHKNSYSHLRGQNSQVNAGRNLFIPMLFWSRKSAIGLIIDPCKDLCMG